MKEEIKQEEKKQTEKVITPEVGTAQQPVWREIIIQTDGNSIKILKAEVAGNIELVGILQSLIGHLVEKK